jgi:hypothetical protein
MRCSSLFGGVVVATILTTASCGGDGEQSKSTAEDGKSGIQSVDFRNRRYTLNCGKPNQTITLDEGFWEDRRGETFGAVRYLGVQYGDATGDGVEDAVVEIDCVSPDVSGFVTNVLVYVLVNGKATQVGRLDGTKPSVEAPGRLAIWTPLTQPDEPTCCPSQYERTVHQYDGQTFVPVETTVRSAADFEETPLPRGERLGE